MADQFSRMYDVERVGGDQRTRLAEMLRANALNAPQGQMVSGWYVPPSMTQNLNQLAQTALGTYMGASLDREQREKVADFLNRYQRGAPTEQAKITNIPGLAPIQGEGQSTPTPLEQTPANQAYAKQPEYRPWTREEKENLLMEAQQIDPRMASMLGSRYDREVAREEARALKEQQQAFQAEQNRLNREGRMDMARLSASLAAANRQEPLVAVMGKDGNPIMLPRGQAVGMTPFNAQTAGAATGSPGARQREAAEAVDIVMQAAPLVRQATSSGIGAAVDWAGGLIGKSATSADKAADLKVLGGMLVSKMPKMSGPQSDKDVMLYKEMAGRIGDPTVPASQKESALQTIYNLNAKYAGLPEQTLSFEPTSVMSGYGAPPAGAVRVKGQ